ncbi:hypothetical protein Tsp_09427 [Trichinella spiralis]|uniref:hypothetical protein n=1 Tax=Trichinella spiralis TaxID=6334 RepID=UPI0001EFD34F|nr:hypothetical protein Tsp_09427 [Trichinella spiralis]
MQQMRVCYEDGAHLPFLQQKQRCWYGTHFFNQPSAGRRYCSSSSTSDYCCAFYDTAEIGRSNSSEEINESESKEKTIIFKMMEMLVKFTQLSLKRKPGSNLADLEADFFERSIK